MNSRRETSENERALVIKWSKNGKSLREIVSLIGKNRGCIQKILQKYPRTVSVANFPGRGRKEILSATAKRKIVRSVKKNPLLSAPKFASSISSEIGKKISAETVSDVFFILQDFMVVLQYESHSLIPSIEKKRLSFAKEPFQRRNHFGTLLFSLMKANLIFTGTTDSIKCENKLGKNSIL
ncbi:uncharacterized protein TNCV_867911 [Trichonephila clavipes]|nr:uncharacterized protein TNCV_867911 [Trichonephila clavipes]